MNNKNDGNDGSEIKVITPDWPPLTVTVEQKLAELESNVDEVLTKLDSLLEIEGYVRILMAQLNAGK